MNTRRLLPPQAKRKTPKEPETYRGIAPTPRFQNEFLTRYVWIGTATPLPIERALWQEFKMTPDSTNAQRCVALLRKNISITEFKRLRERCRVVHGKHGPFSKAAALASGRLSQWVRERLPEEAVIELLSEVEWPQNVLTVSILEWYILTDELPIRDGGKDAASPCYPTMKQWGGHYRAMIRFFRPPSHRTVRQLFRRVPAPKEWKNVRGKTRRRTGPRLIDEVQNCVREHVERAQKRVKERQRGGEEVRWEDLCLFEFPSSGLPEVIVNDGKKKPVRLVTPADVSFRLVRGKQCRCHLLTEKEAIAYYEQHGEGLGDCSCGGTCPYFDRQFGRCFATRLGKVRWMWRHRIALESAPGAIQQWCPPLEGDEPEGWIWLPKPPWDVKDILQARVWRQLMRESERLRGPASRMRWGVAKQEVADPTTEDSDAEPVEDDPFVQKKASPEEIAAMQASDAVLDRDVGRTMRRFEARWGSALTKIDASS